VGSCEMGNQLHLSYFVNLMFHVPSTDSNFAYHAREKVLLKAYDTQYFDNLNEI